MRNNQQPTTNQPAVQSRQIEFAKGTRTKTPITNNQQPTSGANPENLISPTETLVPNERLTPSETLRERQGNAHQDTNNQLFKGIALFTPAGDLIYAIDPSKQGKWHANLCIGLQELLGLPEPPHFLVPTYTATVDRWLDPNTREVQTIAEAYPAVMRYQTLLDAVFATYGTPWQKAEWREEVCEPMIVESYRDRFPQLWEEQDLVVAYDRWQQDRKNGNGTEGQAIGLDDRGVNYVLRLFVSGNTLATEQTLKMLHQLLENHLHSPYTLKIIDIFKHPEQAEINHVSATPTLVRAWPHPVRRIVGELEDLDRVLQIIRMS